jgi:tetratricopeptide (TPR) repeat protein
MIREPAKAAGLIWEQRDGISLDQELLRDATGNPEALPLLEYTLAELYERRDGRLLRWSEYGGGLRSALISAADEVVNGTGGDADAAFREVMRELVGVGDDGAATRRYASLARFPEGSPARVLLDRMVARRLCVTTDERRGDGPVTCLAHEALIRSWPRAQLWLQRETSLLRIRDEVARDAAVWEFHRRADDWLGVAPEKLAAINQVEQASLMPAGASTDYAHASRQRAARNRFIKRGAIAGICALSALAGIAWIVALGQRDIARSEAMTADRTTSFMVSLFQLADPSESRGKAVTVKEVLDRGAKELRTGSGSSLEHEPRTRSELLTAMGRAYAGLGLYPDAVSLLTLARSDQKQASVSDESAVRTLIALGTSHYLDGDDKSAEPVLREAVAVARNRLKPADTLRSGALTALADELVSLKKYPEAEALCDEALIADRKRGPQGAGVLANTLDSLGEAYFAAGNLAEAKAAMLEAVDSYTQAFGRQDARTAMTMNNLGVVLYDFGQYDQALDEYQQVLPLYRSVFGDNHPEVATLLSNIGRVELILGRVADAEPTLRQALQMTEHFLPPGHEFFVSPLNSLGMIDAYQGRLDEARREFEQAESIARRPDNAQYLDQVLLNVADLDLARGDAVGAAAHLDESKKLLEQTYGRDGGNLWRYAVWDTVDAELLAKRGDLATARSTIAAARKIIVQRFGAGGFYSLQADRRARAIEDSSRH